MGKVNLRKEQLLNILSKRVGMSTKEIATEFEISLPTARRLCADLEKEGRVARIHGGIRYLPEIDTSYKLDDAKKEFSEEKKRIAIHASRLIQDKQVIFIESGSSTLAFAQAIAERIQNHELSNIVVFTNSLINMQILSPVCEVSLIGGIYRESQKDFRGYIAERVVSWLTFDFCILGADAISLKEGIMAFDIDSVRLVEALINRSKNSVVLADSSKFYQHSLISIVPANRVSLILTNSGIDEDLYNKYLEMKANIERV